MLKLVEETEGAAKAALHKVEVVAGLVFRDVHRVVGEVIEATELELGNLLESGRAKRAPADAVVGVPIAGGATASGLTAAGQVDVEAKPAVDATTGQASAEPAATNETAAPPAATPPAAQ